MALPADLAPVDFSVSEVGLLFGFLFLWLGVAVIDATRGPIVGLAGGVPLVGGPLASMVDRGFGSARGWLAGNLSASLAAYSELVAWLASLWAQGSQTLLGLAELVTSSAFRLSTVIVPALIESSLIYAEQLVYAAEARADQFAAGVEGRLRGLLGGAEAVAAAGVEAARSEAVGLFRTAEADAANLAAKAEAEAGALFSQAEADLAQAVAGIESEIGAAERQVEADLSALAAETGREIAAARGAIATGAADLGALDARVNQAAHDLGAQITGFEQLLQNEIDSVLKSGPWAALVAAAEVGEAVIRAEVRTLVILSAAEIRNQIGDAEAIRAKYGPQVRAALAELRK